MKLLRYFTPPDPWKIPVFGLLAALLGLGIYTLNIANAFSYLSDEPEVCINCHVMNPQYATWQHSSHREVASCNDCHVPQTSVFEKYWFKAKDGLGHSYMFTFRLEPQVIQIKSEGAQTVQGNCERCHEQLISEVNLADNEEIFHGDGKYCWDCHVETPHGSVRSLSSTPQAQVPNLGSPVPQWLKKLQESE
ncbi:cytochrome c nitrite reductase small subunit [Sediminitomix flava]|uniref:Respiratory nitrite reductase-specific menaquinol--cytochrome-c reductase (NrfH) n=1 Tax=Sediminitomix flava TaxID=379075 RepID=A0A315ZG74_SEDFL|nr:cytochrome c nitrite reductase small subunit [Sediminitomix flava]PWJ44322.1 respiratory nitrite reductase-specific menaquinol--cytochrome-c reductase (NrfH) precursor [Sediminitomix flava]